MKSNNQIDLYEKLDCFRCKQQDLTDVEGIYQPARITELATDCYTDACRVTESSKRLYLLKRAKANLKIVKWSYENLAKEVDEIIDSIDVAINEESKWKSY